MLPAAGAAPESGPLETVAGAERFRAADVAGLQSPPASCESQQAVSDGIEQKQQPQLPM